MQFWNLSVHNAEYKKAMAGEYKERATEFLESHWQRDALASLARHGVRICFSLLFLIIGLFSSSPRGWVRMMKLAPPLLFVRRFTLAMGSLAQSTGPCTTLCVLLHPFKT